MTPVSGLLPGITVGGWPRVGVYRVGRLLGWVVVALGPVLALVIGLARPPAPPSVVAPAPTDEAGQGVAGWAELYVRAWFGINRDTAGTLTAFYPDGIRSQRDPVSQLPVGSTVLSTDQVGPGRWSVVVATEVLSLGLEGKRDTELRCAQVAIAQPQPRSYVALALPALVGCPVTAPAVGVDYPSELPVTGPLGQAVTGFLTAYLTGSGDLPRYTAPDLTLRPVVPAAFVEVSVEGLRAHERFPPGSDGRPGDGAAASVLVRVQGKDAAGQDTTLHYALTLTARFGRWEVSELNPIPITR